MTDLMAERDEAVDAVAAQAAEQGWRPAILAAAGPAAAYLFPAGVKDALGVLHDRLDRRMLEQAGSLEGMRLSQKVRHLVAARLEAAGPYRAALKRALPLAARPRYGLLFARLLARTVDLIWRTAGDRSADANWYSKRAILSAVYGSTMLHWLSSPQEDMEASLAFLDRRLANVAQFGRTKGALKDRIGGIVTRSRAANG